MKQRTATIVGFVAASTIPALGLAALAVQAEIQTHSLDFLHVVLFAGISFLVFYPYSILFTLVLGVPAFFVARRLGIINLWSAIGAGLLVGTLVALAVHAENELYPNALIKFIPAGVVSAIVFWLIWRRGSESTAGR